MKKTTEAQEGGRDRETETQKEKEKEKEKGKPREDNEQEIKMIKSAQLELRIDQLHQGHQLSKVTLAEKELDTIPGA